jgi:hypothetical protein
MKKLTLAGSPEAGIVLAVLLLGLAGQAFSDDWDPIEDANDDFLGNPCFGANLAVAETRYLPLGGQVSLTKLVAITTGEDVVRLYSFDTSGQTPTLTLEDEITITADGIDEPVAWMPTFMTVDFTGNGEEACLVIPVLCDADQQVPAAGSISVVRLTARDQHGQLEVADDCFNCTLGTHWSVYHVAKLPSTGYAISTEFGEDPPPDIDENVIVRATWNSTTSKFAAGTELVLPDMYYGSRHAAIWTRPFVTTCQDFQYGTEFEEDLCITTAHNGGVVIWDPALDPFVIVSRISDAQQGEWRYDNDTWGELGDVHRAVVLEGGSSSFSELDDIEVASRLLFFADNTMGFMVYDISKPDEPQYVWQWDCDTRPREDFIGGEDWDWHGAGDNDSDAIVPAAAGDFPGETFGIGVAANSSDDEESPAIIHMYLAGGVDGLRRFDLTEFLDPFGRDSDSESNFDDFVVDHYNSYSVGQTVMQAHDLQTLSEDGDTYVFTSWRVSREDEDEQEIGLTVHLDEGVIGD